MKLMLITSIIVSTAFIMVSHPMMFIMLILTQTLNICLMMFMGQFSTWFSFILFLIFLGGLMVLFIYVASLASNEKFNFEFMTLVKMITASLFIMLMAMMLYQQQLMNYTHMKINTSLTQMFTNTMGCLTLMTMIYLLMTLVVVVSMASKYEGPLRNMLFK